jgi:hypothetical protein
MGQECQGLCAPLRIGAPQGRRIVPNTDRARSLGSDTTLPLLGWVNFCKSHYLSGLLCPHYWTTMGNKEGNAYAGCSRSHMKLKERDLQFHRQPLPACLCCSSPAPLLQEAFPDVPLFPTAQVGGRNMGTFLVCSKLACRLPILHDSPCKSDNI